MQSDAVESAERLSRFVLDSGKISASKVHYRVFLPSPSDGCTSVFRIEGLTEVEVWELGHAEVATPSARSLHGRADVTVQQVVDSQLQVDPEPSSHVRHANIVGWPHEKPEQIRLAQLLAACARAVPRSSSE